MSQARDFWSKRRAAVQAEQAAREQALAVQSDAADRAVAEARDDAEILADLNLPDPDDLVLGDDIRAFMSKAVPDRLRRRALRRLWRLNPVLANVDGLVDYGEDYTDSATVIENLQTTYQVGKGMLAHLQEMARTDEIAADETDETPDQLAEPEAPASAPPPPVVLAFDEPEDPSPAQPMPRRMRFEFSAPDTDTHIQRT
ncbi:DUF3306 domain-containing protein [Sedimentitalea nanhaiensis]|uniref:DUF3306 domain-containing protein n=1 Tax=Sedimentitalea nanhaiensis TaxID=999627 RepID=A0A1I7ASH0_9RHOB|nr:DUF3306 domain-containing protein [Sedimentitalea nanhaiensis]SFT77872.1 Protein of unknown function [Sedimentitalea nanhaiensis]